MEDSKVPITEMEKVVNDSQVEGKVSVRSILGSNTSSDDEKQMTGLLTPNSDSMSKMSPSLSAEVSTVKRKEYEDMKVCESGVRLGKMRKIDDFDLASYKPLPPLAPRRYIFKHGIINYLDRFLPQEATRGDICKTILNLGYSKSIIANYRDLSVKQLVHILLRMILEDHEFINVLTDEIEPSTNYTLSNLVSQLKSSKKILIITGAGISTSVGIPDFRSFTGLYSQLEHLKLKDPQSVFDINTFKKDPSLFYEIANKILPDEGACSTLHHFIKKIQDKGKLLRNYTQNIDNLERNAGIESKFLVQCHGSFGTATCITCKKKFAGKKIFNHVRKQQIPYCSNCRSRVESRKVLNPIYGAIKPDITFFGEDLPKRFFKLITEDVNNCDLVFVIGTSLKVHPVAGILDRVRSGVPKILINLNSIEYKHFNLSLMGHCDDVVMHLSKMLGEEWNLSTNNHPNISIEEIPDSNVVKFTKVDQD